MIGDLLLLGVIFVALAFICFLCYSIGYDHGWDDGWDDHERSQSPEPEVCGICGMRYAAPGMTACSTCA